MTARPSRLRFAPLHSARQHRRLHSPAQPAHHTSRSAPRSDRQRYPTPLPTRRETPRPTTRLNLSRPDATHAPTPHRLRLLTAPTRQFCSSRSSPRDNATPVVPSIASRNDYPTPSLAETIQRIPQRLRIPPLPKTSHAARHRTRQAKPPRPLPPHARAARSYPSDDAARPVLAAATQFPRRRTTSCPRIYAPDSPSDRTASRPGPFARAAPLPDGATPVVPSPRSTHVFRQANALPAVSSHLARQHSACNSPLRGPSDLPSRRMPPHEQRIPADAPALPTHSIASLADCPTQPSAHLRTANHRARLHVPSPHESRRRPSPHLSRLPPSTPRRPGPGYTPHPWPTSQRGSHLRPQRARQPIAILHPAPLLTATDGAASSHRQPVAPRSDATQA